MCCRMNGILDSPKPPAVAVMCVEDGGPMALRCESCGAAARQDESECRYCGSGRMSTAPVAAREPTSDELLAEVRDHPRFGELMRHQPSAGGHYASAGCTVAFLVAFTGMAIFMTAKFQMAPAPMSYFPLLFVGFGIFGLISTIRKTSRLANAPLIRTPAQVLDERVSVSGGGKNQRATTTYYVTLSREGGSRKEYQASAKVAGDVVRGDVGVAYLKDDHLLEFRRLADGQP